VLGGVLLSAAIAGGCGNGTSGEATGEPSSSTTPPTRATTTTSASTTTTTLPAPTTTTTVPPPPPPPEPAVEVLRRGAEGPLVALVQQRLVELGFRPGEVNGSYGAQTYAAVMAFQKHEGLDPDGHTGPITIAALRAGLTQPGARGGPTPRIEIDLDRQVAFVVAPDGQTRVVNVSSGNGERYARPQGGTATANTPTGSFDIERRIDGVRVAPLGQLYRPLYFKGGFAIHGSSNVPGYPASHGCVRTTNPDQDYIWETLENGTPVEIYDA
jgi:peptidoglycan hydrolase-like protein with peptidoglycan-binding domain